MKKLLIFTGSSLVILSLLTLLGKFGFMNDMRREFTWRDVDLYEASLDFITGLGLAILCFIAAGKRQKKR